MLVRVRPAGAVCERCRGNSASLRTGRAPFGSLGTTMMRRMIGRYKDSRCARMAVGVKLRDHRRRSTAGWRMEYPQDFWLGPLSGKEILIWGPQNVRPTLQRWSRKWGTLDTF